MKVNGLGVGNFLDGCGQMAFVIEDHCPAGHACTAVVNLGLEDRIEVVKAILKFTKMPKADLSEFANDLDGGESIPRCVGVVRDPDLAAALATSAAGYIPVGIRNTAPGDEPPCLVPGDEPPCLVPGDEPPCLVIPGDRHAVIKAIEAAVLDAGKTQREMIHGQNMRAAEEVQKNIERMTGWLMSVTGTLYKK